MPLGAPENSFFNKNHKTLNITGCMSQQNNYITLFFFIRSQSNQISL